MLRRWVRWGLGRPRLLCLTALWLAALCGLYASRLGVEFLPDVTPAQLFIDTDAPGLTAEQVEATVTRPLEAVLLAAPGIGQVDSRSMQGLSVVTVELAPGADPALARQGLAEDLGRAGQLPPGVAAPRLSPLVAPGPHLMTIGFTSARLSPKDLRDLVQWVVRPRLLSTPGVASAALYGGEQRRIEVHARPGDLSDSDLGFLDMLRAVRSATGVTGAGFIDTPNQRVLIEPHGQAMTPRDVGAGQIQIEGEEPTRIDDVADVVEAAAPAQSLAFVMGRPAVIVVVDRAFGAEEGAATDALDRTIADLRPGLTAQRVQVRADLERPNDFADAAALGDARDLAIGVLLAVIGLWIVVREPRIVLVSIAPLALAILAAAAAARLCGWRLDAMTIGGLAVAAGIVLDDAVIDVETIAGRLRAAPAHDETRREAVASAAGDARGTITLATLALAVAIAPLALTGGPEHQLIAPLAGVLLVAVGASLLASLTVTPALALMLLPIDAARPGRSWARPLQRRYAASLAAILRRPGLAAGLGLLAGLAGVALLLARPVELLPPIGDGRLTAVLDSPASASPEAVGRAALQIGARLSALPGVRVVSARAGRDATGYGGESLGRLRFDVGLDPAESTAAQARVLGDAEAALLPWRGMAPVVQSGFASGAPGADRPALQIDVAGSDLGAISAEAARVQRALAAMRERAILRAPLADRAPAMRVDLDFQRLALFGLSAADVLETVQAAFAGETVARVYAGQRVEDVAVSAQDSLRRDPETIGQLLLRSTSGISTPLSSVANVYLTDGPAEIRHAGGLRLETIEAAPLGGGLGRYQRAARRAIDQGAPPPPGVFVDYRPLDAGGEMDRRLAGAYGLGLFGLLAFLAIAFDLPTAGLTIASTLFAFLGAALALAVTGGALSIGAVAGLFALVGLSVRSAVLLVGHAEDVARARPSDFAPARFAWAAGARLAPELGSTLLVILTLTPFVFDAGAPGREVIGPLAIVVCAGMATGTAGDLFILPAILRLAWRPRRAAAGGAAV